MTMFQRIVEHMTKDMTALAPSTTKINFVAPLESQYSVQIGGSPFFFPVDVISRASTMDLARPSFCCLDTELKSTAERFDNLIHMLSDGDFITVGIL